MAHQAPLFTSAMGINLLAMTMKTVSPPPSSQVSLEVIGENSWEFTALAAALNIGLNILESPAGTAALIALGTSVVQEWRTYRNFHFGGDVSRMAEYVRHFIVALRDDFPNVFVEPLGGPHVLAAVQRIPEGRWNGDLLAFRPKECVAISFNACRVASMVAAVESNHPKMKLRYKHFMFMFGCATSHELCHAFVAYLSRNSTSQISYTPPSVTYLNYGYTMVDEGTGSMDVGESGRWFESKLFGGSLEFYEDPQDDSGQVGIAYVLDHKEVAWKIKADAIVSLVHHPTSLQVPFERVRGGISSTERTRRRMRSLGSTDADPNPQVARSFMRAAFPIRSLNMYYVSREALVDAARGRGRIRAVRVR